MDVNDVHERVDIIAPFHDRKNGVEEHGRLIADDVAAKDLMLGRDEELTEAIFFFYRAALCGIEKRIRRRRRRAYSALFNSSSVAPTPAISGIVKTACGIGP